MIERFWQAYDRDPIRVTCAVLAAVAFVVILALFSVARATAATAPLSWTAPTQRTDGTALTPAEIAGYQIDYALCSTGNVFPAPPAGSSTVPASPTSASVTVPGYGNWCFRVRTVDSAGNVSANTGTVYKAYLAPPNPPTGLAVAVIAGMAQTPVYSVAENGSMSTFVGFADVGTSCSGPVLFTYRSKSFREVPRASAKLWGSTTLRLAAPCVGG